MSYGFNRLCTFIGLDIERMPYCYNIKAVKTKVKGAGPKSTVKV